MIRRPPISTRTDTLFPYTTLFRSARILLVLFQPGIKLRLVVDEGARSAAAALTLALLRPHAGAGAELAAVADELILGPRRAVLRQGCSLGRLALGLGLDLGLGRLDGRSEVRRFGNACVSTCSSRWSPAH